MLTRSNARRGEFAARAAQMGYEGPAPIAGWGVRWNIDLAMFSNLVSARDVIPLAQFFFFNLSHYLFHLRHRLSI